ncbi:putative selenium-dependent hydroxylase accessory protein YqeC, partial [Peptostreptococcaceae bacterium OttesenSCG-928-C18]|nr:putative selenium-dependent hydroxylase accessory protein YqeC [Peptostreptococcaceae bacterium OttesenSCG-928-C18]
MLSKLLKLEEKDILSLVGSGGKTITMYRLGRELNKNKVLLTTSTKIGKIEIDNVITLEKFSDIEKMKISNEVYVSGNTINNNKFTGITNEQLEEVKDKFDYIIIEADGSKRLPLKGWRDKEPVILNSSNKTLGIIPFDLYGKKLLELEIFQREIFMSIVGEE